MMDGRALANAIHSKQVSCVEVMTAYLDHIENINPHVNAIVALQDGDSLLAQARVSDEQLARGEPIGSLHGFPFAAKDLIPVKGLRMTMGSPILKDFIPDADSVMAERLRRAGAIFIGKTNSLSSASAPTPTIPSTALPAMLMISPGRREAAAAVQRSL